MAPGFRANGLSIQRGRLTLRTEPTIQLFPRAPSIQIVPTLGSKVESL